MGETNEVSEIQLRHSALEYAVRSNGDAVACGLNQKPLLERAEAIYQWLKNGAVDTASEQR